MKRYIFIILLAFAPMAFGDGDKPTAEPKPAVADQPTLDELLGLTDPKPTPATNDTDADKADVVVDPLDKPTAPEREPFKRAVAEMAEAAQRLGPMRDPGIATQRIQLRVILRLDQLLSEMRKKKCKGGGKNQSSCDNGSQGNPSKPKQGGGATAANNVGPMGVVQNHNRPDQPLTENLAKQWGNLPPRLRDQVLQGLQDRFSQLYRGMTERYYRRLAEENE